MKFRKLLETVLPGTSVLTSAILLACSLNSLAEIKIVKDVTLETYGIDGQGRAKDTHSYYFLQSEKSGAAKIKPEPRNEGETINVENEGEFVYFHLQESGKYLTLLPEEQNVVKWVKGKTSAAKWKRVAPVHPTADEGWHSYVASADTKLHLRHYSYVMRADPNDPKDVRYQNPETFNGDATWKIEAGMIIPPAGTVNGEAYGIKNLQTLATGSQETNNYLIGVRKDEQAGIVDRTNKDQRNLGEVVTFEVRYKKSSKQAILVNSKTGNFLTTDGKGNITFTPEETSGSLWSIEDPIVKKALSDGFFSLKANLKNEAGKEIYLRHEGYILWADPSDTNRSSMHFKGDATWKFLDVK